jgi:hypothetical protein
MMPHRTHEVAVNTTVAGCLLQIPSEPQDTGNGSYLALGFVIGVIALGLFVWRSMLKKKTAASPSPTDMRSAKDSAATKKSKLETLTPQPLATPPAIFISYRRQDSSDVTGRIYDRLAEQFGKHAVFKDVDSIPLGVDFRKHLSDSVGKCNVLLAVIGRNWLAGLIEKEARDQGRDYVKIEVEAALQRDIPVVPVLVQSSLLPSEEELPQSMRSLAYRNAILVRPDPDFHQDMDRLIRGIEGYLKK